MKDIKEKFLKLIVPIGVISILDPIAGIICLGGLISYVFLFDEETTFRDIDDKYNRMR